MADWSSFIDSGEKSVERMTGNHAVEVRMRVEVRVRVCGLGSHQSS